VLLSLTHVWLFLFGECCVIITVVVVIVVADTTSSNTINIEHKTASFTIVQSVDETVNCTSKARRWCVSWQERSSTDGTPLYVCDCVLVCRMGSHRCTWRRRRTTRRSSSSCWQIALVRRWLPR